MKNNKRTLISTLFALCLFQASAANAEITGSSVGGKPAYPRDDNPRSESIFVHTVDLGETVEDGVLVVNHSDETKTIMIDAVDHLVSSGGAFACKQKNDPQTEVGTWITLDKAEVTLESQTSEIVPFQIKVPKSAEIGEHNGCIVIQEKTSTPDNASGINLFFRAGIRVALTVPGEIDRRLRIIGVDISYNREKETIVFTARASNPGNVSVDAIYLVRVYDLFGGLVKEFESSVPVLRGEEVELNFEWPQPMLGGFYRVEFETRYIIGDYISIGEENSDQYASLTTEPELFFARPTKAGLAVELVISAGLIACLLTLLLAIKRKRWIKTSWINYTVGAGETIHKLAKWHDVSWKLLAKANKLKAPYQLDAGQVILLPPQERTGKASTDPRPTDPPAPSEIKQDLQTDHTEPITAIPETRVPLEPAPDHEQDQVQPAPPSVPEPSIEQTTQDSTPPAAPVPNSSETLSPLAKGGVVDLRNKPTRPRPPATEQSPRSDSE